MKRVVLLGAGPAHLQWLHQLAREPLAAAEVVMLAPTVLPVYTPLLPSLVAGHRPLDRAQVDLSALAQVARVRLLQGRCLQLDSGARQLHTAAGEVIGYDLLSLDCGPAIDRDALPGAREHGLFVWPAEPFVQLLDALLALARERVLDLVVVGDGLAAAEMALALQARLCHDGDERARVAWVSGPPPLLPAQAPAFTACLLRALKRRRITVFHDRCVRVDAGAVQLAGGARLACDAPVIATESGPPGWLQRSDVQRDDQGAPALRPTRQSLSHPELLVPSTAAAAAAVLAQLRRLVGGEALPPVPMPPLPMPPATPPSGLQWLDCGDRSAIVGWQGLALRSQTAWWLRQRRLQARLRRLTTLPQRH